MNISLENVDKVSAVLTVKIEKADYQEKVEKALKSLRQKVNMPGFRKGMVPMSLVKKQYRILYWQKKSTSCFRKKYSNISAKTK